MRYPSTYRGLKQDVGAVISEIFFPFLCFNEKVRRAKPGHPVEFLWWAAAWPTACACVLLPTMRLETLAPLLETLDQNANFSGRVIPKTPNAL